MGISAISHIFPELDQELNAVNVELDTDLYSFGCQTHGLTLSNAKGNIVFLEHNGNVCPEVSILNTATNRGTEYK